MAQITLLANKYYPQIMKIDPNYEHLCESKGEFKSIQVKIRIDLSLIRI